MDAGRGPIHPVEVPPGLAAVGARVEARIAALLEPELDRWRRVDPDLEAPLAALLDFVTAGGKRLRPAFCHWAFVGAGGDPTTTRSSTPVRRSSCCTPSRSSTTT